eukprot:jgi/Botrbrau1/7674/Bobra.0159s0116.1
MTMFLASETFESLTTVVCRPRALCSMAGMVDQLDTVLTFLKLMGISYLTYISSKYMYHWMRIYLGLYHLPRPPQWIGLPPGAFTAQRHEVLLGLTETLGKVFYCRILWHKILIIGDPRLAAEVFNDPRIGKAHLFYDDFMMLLGGTRAQPNMECAYGGTAPDESYHRAVRKGFAPSFSIQNVRKRFEDIKRSAPELLSLLKSKGPGTAVEITHALMCATLDTIGCFAANIEVGAVESLSKADKFHLITALDEANAYVDKVVGNPLLSLLPFLPLHAKGKRAMATFHNYISGVLDQVLARGTPAHDDVSVAAQMVRIRDPQGNPLSYTSMQAQLNTLFHGGYDTTGNTMAWTLFLVSSHPDVEEKVTAELREAGLLASPSCPSPRPLELSDLSRLPYMAAVSKESMRLYPVAAAIGPRMSRSSDILLSNGLLVPRGIIIWPMVYLMHRHSSLWSEANRFMPERWLKEPPTNTSNDEGRPSGDANISQKVISDQVDSGAGEGRIKPTDTPSAWMPYILGRRDCMGKVLAETRMMATLATLLGNFHFKLAKRMGSPEEVAASSELRIGLVTKDGMWLHAIPRSGSHAL